jgi:glycine dehydrogenase subunit 2
MTKTVFEKSQKGRKGVKLPPVGVEAVDCNKFIPSELLRKSPVLLPELTELDVVRHFTNLSKKNFCVDSNFYPLGSCTMKYNPKVTEYCANLSGFTDIHPEQNEKDVQGALELMYRLGESLKTITGMDAVSLQPAAGAHGEFAGMLIAKKYFELIKENRTKVIIPDSAHGTNPASAKMCGFDVIEVKSGLNGILEPSAIEALLDKDTAVIMMTNPNTLGLFEENIKEISDLAHKNGTLLYYDGANLNAILGITNPGLMGFDIMHINLHKTFATPHGGGGPGAGPVLVSKKLEQFLPIPAVRCKDNNYYLDFDVKNTVGKTKAFYGNFGVLVKAYAYILSLGKEGIKATSEDAVLNANYLKEKLKTLFQLPYDKLCMHEFVLSAENKKQYGVNALAIAKRIIDYGIHPPTIYFPLIVHEAMMIEPTETENKETLDAFVEILKQIENEIQTTPEKLLNAPLTAYLSKVDETVAARQLNLRWKKEPPH